MCYDGKVAICTAAAGGLRIGEAWFILLSGGVRGGRRLTYQRLRQGLKETASYLTRGLFVENKEMSNQGAFPETNAIGEGKREIYRGK